jgi:hypothetical protein
MAEFETAGGSPGSAPMAWPWGPLVRVMRDTLIPGRCCRRHPAEDEGNYHGNCGDFGVGWPKIHCFFMFFFEEMSLCRGPWIDMEDTRALPVDARPCAKQQWQEELSLLNSL